MSEDAKVTLTGWPAVIALVFLAGVLCVRLMTFSDMSGDEELMAKIQVPLSGIYNPHMVEKVREAAFGKGAAADNAVSTALSTKMHVESVQTSYPLFKFSTRKKVVVKVRYSMEDDSGAEEKGTVYYLFDHNSISNHWSYQYETTSWHYYLNFF